MLRLFYLSNMANIIELDTCSFYKNKAKSIRFELVFLTYSGQQKKE
jgi:hypothetical protein